MSHHYVYLPQASIPKDKTAPPLTAVGLADHVACADRKPIPTGPDGGPGLLYAWLGGQQDKRWQFTPEEQDWTPTAASETGDAGRFGVGTWKDSPPTPDGLKRPGRDPWGEPIELNGAFWLLPPVDMLPKSIGQFPDGTSGLRVKPEYRHLADDSDTWRARLMGPPTMVPLGEMVRFVTACLAVNYRIDPTLAMHLGLFDERNIKEAMFIALTHRDHYLKQPQG
jgi:hypothetical protein